MVKIVKNIARSKSVLYLAVENMNKNAIKILQGSSLQLHKTS